MRLTAAILLTAAAPALAQGWPAKPVRLVIPYAPGGPVDITGRLTAQKLGEALGQQVVVDNRAGANGNIAVELVARAPADGYTLLMGANGPIAINPSLYAKLPADPVRDLAPVSMVAASPMILVAHPSLPVSSVRELVALAKARPGAINFASSGSGSTAHLSGELFRSMAGVSLVHVPYKGAGPALTDLVAGQTQVMFTGVSSTLPYVKSRRLRALGVSSEKRLPILPDVPTVGEAVRGYEVLTWYGVFAPAGTPAPIIDAVAKAVAASFATPEARDRLAALGADPNTLPAAEFAKMIRVEVDKWARVVRESGARPE
jgi:tripartite-type tricarboxylate transporter receptor subunit TctC